MGTDRGWKVPGYTLEHVLGYGATGEVWRARVTRTGEAVAVKRMLAADAATVRAARAEAALLSALEHPNLLRLREFVPLDGAMALVLELAAGGSLADLLDRRGRLAPGEVVSTLAPVAAALAYAHDEGVSHCDVSAGNVLFTDEGRPLLADLGVARLLGDVAPVHGTPAYLDPSVAAGSAPGPPSDVFALGAVALHALTGRPPWEAASVEQTVALAAGGEIPGLDDRLRDVAPAVADLLRRALAPEPHLRTSAAEFALDLRHTVEPVPVELAAGRPAPEHDSGFWPRHAAPDVGPDVGPDPDQPVGSVAVEVSPLRAPEPGAGGLAFDRPDWREDEAAGLPGSGPGTAAVLTHAVRARLRCEPSDDAAPRRWWRGWSTEVGRRAIMIVLVLAVVAAAAVGGWWWTHRPPARATVSSTVPSPAAPTRSVAPTTPVGTSSAPAPSAPPAPRTAASPTRSSPNRSAPAPGPPDWAGVLRRLDDRRVEAFAHRTPAGLTGVYTGGPLLSQDVASLARTVPASCGLSGLRTDYRAVSASRRADGSVRIMTTATLAAGTLRCAGHAVATSAPRGPVRMTLLLVRQGPRYRISRLELSG